MASDCELVVAAESQDFARSAMEAAGTEVLRIEAKFSRYRADSVIGRINAAAGGAPVGIDEETGFLLDFAAALHRDSDGLFDITSGVLRRAWRFPDPVLPTPEALDALLPLVKKHAALGHCLQKGNLTTRLDWESRRDKTDKSADEQV